MGNLYYGHDMSECFVVMTHNLSVCRHEVPGENIERVLSFFVDLSTRTELAFQDSIILFK